MTRREWCALVATLCAPGMQATATQGLWDMLPAFNHFSDWLFTTETAHAVALAPRKLATPAFDEISRTLNEHRRNYGAKPLDEYRRVELPTARPALEPPPLRTGPPSAEEVAAVRDLVQQCVAALRPTVPPKSGPFPEQAKPLRDVTLKGERLRKSREARGLTTPLPDETT